jgi:hypothetical protein
MLIMSHTPYLSVLRDAVFGMRLPEGAAIDAMLCKAQEVKGVMKSGPRDRVLKNGDPSLKQVLSFHCLFSLGVEAM